MVAISKRDVVVVGGGHAGAHVAAALRKKGFSGSILTVSNEATMPYERPPLSKEYLLGSIAIERIMLREGDFWEAQKIEFELGRSVVALDADDAQVVLDDGRRVAFDWCILATGGKVRELTCPGARLAGVHYLRTVADVDAIRRSLATACRLVIVGAGFVGLEVAAAARELGHEVTVLEAQSRVLARVTCPVVSEFYRRQHEMRGVKIRLGAQVDSLLGADSVAGVKLVSGEEIEADMVIVGIGIDAETRIAEEAGIDCDGGILVDRYCRTSAPNVFAIGDCSRHINDFAGGLWRLESVQHAIDSAEVAAEAIMGSPRPYQELPTFWSDQYDLKLQTAGIGKDAEEIIIRGDAENGPMSAIYLREGRVIAVDAINSPRDFMAARKLIQNRATPDRALLADPSIPLKSLA